MGEQDKNIDRKNKQQVTNYLRLFSSFLAKKIFSREQPSRFLFRIP